MLEAQHAAHHVRGAFGGPTRRLAARAAAVLLCACLLFAAGCAKTRAAGVPDGPPLAVPQPPSRVLAPVEEEPVATNPRPDPPPVNAQPQNPPQRPPAARANPATPNTESRPEPAPSATSSTPPPPPPEPARELRPAALAGEATEVKEVERLLATAKKDLDRQDYGKLSENNRESYNQVKSFSDQAQKAIKEKNLPYALTLAQKAATMAAALAASR